MLGRSSQNSVSTATVSALAPARMKLRYGFNEIYGWWHLSQGPHREEIQRRLRLMDTKVVRLFVFDQPVPDPFRDWHAFERLVQAVLDVGAKPMITFAKFPPPYDSKKNRRIFMERASEVVWGCIERWGGKEVGDWYWCVWNEPNNFIVGGDVSYEDYFGIYEEISSEILRLLAPHLGTRRAMIGGPAIDGTHRAYWMDWIAKLLAQVKPERLGFVSWHCYGDWRPAVPSSSLNLELWGSPDSPDGELFEELLMAQTPGYEGRARGVARLLAGHDVLNVCGELNAMSHHELYYTLGHNQNLLGAAYYASALIHLIRGGADLEMRWTATEHKDAYGIISMAGAPSAAALAKQLFVQHVRYGDEIMFPANRIDVPQIDAIVASGSGGRRSAIFVNTSRKTVRLRPAEWDARIEGADSMLTLDSASDGKVRVTPYKGECTLQGYGMAVITDAAADTVID